MRKVMVGLISLGLILSVTSPCFAKKKKTGEVKKNVYTDSKFGFQITALSNWKVKTEKEPSLLRVLMTQKNYKVSRVAGVTRYSTTIPSILVLADTTSLSLAEVESCLFQEGKKLKNKDAYMMKLDLIHNSGKEVSSGIYFYRIIARTNQGSEDFVKCKKMTLLK